MQIRPLEPLERKVLMALIDAGGLNSIQLAKALMLTRRYVQRLIENLLYEGLIEKRMTGKTTPRGGTPAQYGVTLHGERLLKEME